MVPRDPAPRTQHAHYPHWHQARFARRPRHDREAQGEANGPHRLPPGPPARQGDQRRQVPRVLCPDTEGSQGEKKKIVLIFHLLLTHDSPLSRTCLMRPSEQSLAPPHAPRPRRAACFCKAWFHKKNLKYLFPFMCRKNNNKMTDPVAHFYFLFFTGDCPFRQVAFL